GGDLELDKARYLLCHTLLHLQNRGGSDAGVAKDSPESPTGAAPPSKRNIPLCCRKLCWAAVCGARPACFGPCGHSTSSAWSSSSSTGVSLQNMETVTRMRFFSTSISSTVPIKPSRGPSTMLTESPTL